MFNTLSRLKHISKSLIAHKAQMILSHLGYNIVPMNKYQPVDYRQSQKSAIEAFFDNGCSPVLVDVEPKQCRNALGIPFSSNCSYHFIKDIANAKQKEEMREVITKALKTYYNRYDFDNAIDFLGITAEEAPGLDGAPFLGYVHPWDKKRYDLAAQQRLRTLSKHAAVHGSNIKLKNIHINAKDFQNLRIDSEVNRIYKLIRSVSKNGYIPKTGYDENINVKILRNDNELAFFVLSGNHRLVVAEALKIEHIPVQVVRDVSLHDIHIWPQVQRGVISATGAHKILNRFLQGTPPPKLITE